MRPSVGTQQPDDQLQQRGLAAAVRAHQAHPFLPVQTESATVQHRPARIVAVTDVVQPNESRVHAHSSTASDNNASRKTAENQTSRTEKAKWSNR
jgi:hypothetical protein